MQTAAHFAAAPHILQAVRADQVGKHASPRQSTPAMVEVDARDFHNACILPVSPAMSEPPIRMYTSEEVAVILKCVPSTVEAAWRARRLPGVRIGQHWQVPASALREGLHQLAMANMTPEPDAEKPLQHRVTPSKATKQRQDGPPALPPLPPILQRGADLQKSR